jgi:hypothetical protein
MHGLHLDIFEFLINIVCLRFIYYQSIKWDGNIGFRKTSNALIFHESGDESKPINEIFRITTIDICVLKYLKHNIQKVNN